MRVSATAFTLVAQSVAIILNYKVGQTKNSLEGEGVYIDNLWCSERFFVHHGMAIAGLNYDLGGTCFQWLFLHIGVYINLLIV